MADVPLWIGKRKATKDRELNPKVGITIRAGPIGVASQVSTSPCSYLWLL
jgi:hypothetical protein